MRLHLPFTLAAALAFAAPAHAEFLLTRKVHTDAHSIGQNSIPAKDSTQSVWMTKNKMRVQTEDTTMIVRLDEKKMYLLDATAKTASVIDLPFDMKKYVPPEVAPMYEQNKPVATVMATEETKKVGDWNARKYTVTIASARGPSSKEEVWVTKDLPMPLEIYKELSRQVLSLSGASDMAEEMQKLDGVQVLSLRTRTMGKSEVKSREELVSFEHKDAPAGTFEVPGDYTQKPFNVMDLAKSSGAAKKN